MTTTHPIPTGRRARLATVALGAALVLGACGGPATSVAQDAADRPTTTETTEPAQTTEPVASVAVDETAAEAGPAVRAVSTVAMLEVFAAPDAVEVVATLGARTEFDSARVLLVEDADSTAGWVRVQLPVRPNGTSGWVRAADVTLEEIDALVEVDLEARTVTAWLDGEILFETAVAVGSLDNPTPTGTFFVTDKVDTGNEGGAYGPYALGLSAHSDTLTEFAGGDGQIGLHGTNAPDSIGQAVSHGCVRLPNELITMLATELPLGTPVVIA